MAGQRNATGYGPRRDGGKWQRLVFDGQEENYELWEVKFLGHMKMSGLKDTILSTEEPEEGEDAEADAQRNEECYAELIQYLDDRSLSLVMREASDDGRKALQILRSHYASHGKPRIIALYTELTSLRKEHDETVTDYILRAEKTVTALRNAKEVISDGLIIAMILKGLPESYKPFVVHATQSSEDITFTDFKSKLRSYEETEKFDNKPKTDTVMKVDVSSVTCYRCGKRGHIAKDCREKGEQQQQKKWCSYHKSSTHTDETCRSRKYMQKDDAKQAAEGADVQKKEEQQTFVFKVSQEVLPDNIKKNGLMVDCGATSHIITEKNSFKRFDRSFNPELHFMELADGTRRNNVALERGDAEVTLRDIKGRDVVVTLKKALFIPSYPQSIISVEAVATDGAKVIFQKGQNELITRDGTVIRIEEQERLYYVKTVINHDEHCADDSVNDILSSDKVNLTCDFQKWHEILGHCNADDVLKLPDVVEGMKITGNTKLDCNVCTEGKFTNTRNRKLDAKAKAPLELVHTDLAGPIDPTGQDGHKYAISFTDDFSGAVAVYFIKNKSDATQATQKFLSDSAPFGSVKCIRSDGGGEYTGEAFQSLLRDRGIRHETSCPHSPHQNGTAERQWRTLFEMGRCLLLESKLPKTLWPYAVQTAAHIRNRCYNDRIKNTPYFMLTGRKPNLANMWVFGSECYAYKHDHKKLDPRCEKGIFVGYSKNSPAYLVYNPHTEKVTKHRLVKFIKKNSVEQQTQTDDETEAHEYTNRKPKNGNDAALQQIKEIIENQSLEENEQVETDGSQNGEITGTVSPDTDSADPKPSDSQNQRYPRREKKPPKYLEDYISDFGDEDVSNASVDYCYRAICGVPQTYKEALQSPEATEWQRAMKEEVDSLKQNDTFELTSLPVGRNVVGGKWVYALKENAEKGNVFKARYVAKGYNQTEGIDYNETFSPTANITSVRALMQIAVQNDLIVHQMDVKTAFLHAPLEEDIYLEQPEGFDKTEKGEKLVCKLKKSLYGLKQSGRNWYKLLNDHLEQDNFVRNLSDHCVYRKQIGDEQIIVTIWVDDLIIAASSNDLLKEFKGTMKAKFNMKDLGKISYFLGIKFEQHEEKIIMDQKRYILKMLERFGMSDCKPRYTPCEPKIEWVNNDEDHSNKLVNPREYREIIGSLIYAMTCTRPDISWIVSKLSQTLANPKAENMVAAKHFLRYLKGTIEYELCFKKSDENLNLIAFSDSDWASSVEDRRSTTGYCFSLTKQGPAISWKSKKQATVALSTCEAEYMGLAATTQESLYLSQLLSGMDNREYSGTKIYGDNQGAIALSKNPVNRQRSKHIDVRYHFIRTTLSEGKIDLIYCPTEDMVADILTKPVGRVRMNKFKTWFFGS